MTDLRSQLQSSLGDAYAIERELGGGGMSRVFLATERALGRKVVIKVLPVETAGAVSIDRFQREIGVAARLQQANIVPLLSAGDAGGVPYFTMPYVEGESLRARLAKGGELPIPEAVGILKEVARALAYAHSQNVVHRDIKPDNVLVSGGTAMVTDFGVAKALSAATTAGGESLTATGLAIGTPAYMSPEQATGDSAVDHRADIYAFGCLAYELLSGTAPFASRTPQQMIAAHLTEQPDPIERRRPAVSWQLAALVARCLAKNPADRPQAATELIGTLEQAVITPPAPQQARAIPARRSRFTAIAATIILVGGAVLAIPIIRRSGGVAPRSIAVMPLVNKTGDSSLAYLAEGLSDELRSMLQVPGLSVKARSSSMKLADSSARVVGRLLSVDAVLEGSLSGSPGHPTVVVELVRTSDETSLLSRTFEVGTAGGATRRDSLTREIASALRVRIAGSIPTLAAARGTASDSAYHYYLRGEYFRRRFDYTSAVPALRMAVAADPGFSRAHAALAIALAGEPVMGTAPLADALALARVSAEKATRLDPEGAKTLVARGLISWIGDWRLAASETAFRAAVVADPTDMEARIWLGFVVGAQGRLDEANAINDEVIRLDPLSVDALVIRQASLMYRRRHTETLAATRAVLELDPKNPIAHFNLIESYAFAGNGDSTVLAVENGLAQMGTDYGSTLVVMFGYASAGRWDKVRELRRRAESEPTNSPNLYRLMIHIVFGEHVAAMRAFEHGVRAKEPLFNTFFLGCEPMLEPLRKMPEFESLMRDLGIRTCPIGSPWPIHPAPRQQSP